MPAALCRPRAPGSNPSSATQCFATCCKLIMMPETLCYFDNNATTRVAPEVVDAMVPFLKDHWGNPSSAYVFGHKVRKSIEDARAKVAALINADPREIIFTSCGTESDNSAIHSALSTQPDK